MTEYYKAGIVRVIGVSYFSTERMADMCAFNEVKAVIIIKTTHKNRMKENIDIFDFALTPYERR